MNWLPHSDLQTLTNCIREIYSDLNIDSMPAHIISAISKIVPSSISAIHAMTTHKRKMAVVEVSSNAELTALDAYNRHIHEHPIIGPLFPGKEKPHPFKDDIERGLLRNRLRPNSATKISDMLTNSQFRSLALFNEFYRPNGIEYQMGMPLLFSKDFLAGLNFNRDKVDFSEKDRLMLNLLGPHIIQAYRNAKAVSDIRQNLQASAQAQARAIDSLTLRESEVLHWLAQGKDNAEIAVILNIAVDTVKKHLTSIYQKLGVENRMAAAMMVAGMMGGKNNHDF